MNLPKRKHPRLKEYDYSQNGAYFVTICTKGKKPVLSQIDLNNYSVKLLKYGYIVDKLICSISKAYPNISVINYVIMPNHLHLLLIFTKNKGGGMGSSRPTTLNLMVRGLKSLVTREVGFSIWQQGFYEHIIRNKRDFLIHYKYIDNNPAKWALDKYYVPNP